MPDKAAPSARRRSQAGFLLFAALIAGAAGLVFMPGAWPALMPVSVFVLAAVLLQTTAQGDHDESDAGVAPPGAPAHSADGMDTLADAFGEPLLLIGRDAVIVSANSAADEAFGPALSGMAMGVRFRSPEMVEFVTRLISDGTASVKAQVGRGSQERWYEVEGRFLGHDSPLHAVFFHDISQASKLERMRADFIANASHELRTPLASISGFLETLQGPARNDAAARDKFIAIMQAQTARMARLIDDLLSLSRLEMKPFARPQDIVDLTGLVAGVVQSMQHLAADAGVTIEFVPAPVEAMVNGDRDELIQVFENLVENACKYGAGGRRVVIAIGKTERNGAPWLVASVRDFGAGIAPEHLPRITERFYRVDAETSRLQKGTGLGLSIVKHIINRHGGILDIESRPGEGSVFTVSLPAARA